MPRNKRLDQATIVETLTPPTVLPPTQSIAQFLTAAGKNLYNVALPSTVSLPESLEQGLEGNAKRVLVEMPPKFRSTVWLKRGGFVVVELKHLKEGENERDNKIAGEIVNVVGDEKAWRKAPWWPKEFGNSKAAAYEVDSDGDDNGQGRVGALPPSDSDSEG